ncbi:NfeD family protein [Rapidithrix thailandica]|uniref:NfeD family protein n=1 Tax=Rapidithrix thailandica TaxID=413964 RepID=A0AAW9S8M8_9BACT
MKVLLVQWMLCLMWSMSYAQSPTKVLVMEIRNDIDPRMNRYVELALDHATEIKADVVLIDMDTYGGAVNDADDIRTRILEYEKPVYVFINNNAASAGALISIASDSIYMRPGANIGAATVVMGGDGAKAPDKYQSYMRSMMRSTAEANGRNPKIAEAMVDENLEVEGVSEAGQVLTFTATEAQEHGFCEGIYNSLEDVLAANKIENYEMVKFELDATEKIIALVLNPFVSGILILVIIGGIYFELQTPGIGFPLAAATIAVVLYFIPHYLNGLAANWEILIFVIGLALIGAEIFVIPGFGIAGISGIVLTLASLVLVMLNNDFFDFTFVPMERVLGALTATLSGTLGAVILMFFGASRIGNTQFFQRVALANTLDKESGYTSSFNEGKDLEGKQGTAYTVLRPSGKVMIEDELYDAYTRGNFIDKGENIVVVSQKGTSLKVKKAE